MQIMKNIKISWLANEEIYELNTKNKEVKEQLNDILGRPILITSLFESGDAAKFIETFNNNGCTRRC